MCWCRSWWGTLALLGGGSMVVPYRQVFSVFSVAFNFVLQFLGTSLCLGCLCLLFSLGSVPSVLGCLQIWCLLANLLVAFLSGFGFLFREMSGFWLWLFSSSKFIGDLVGHQSHTFWGYLLVFWMSLSLYWSWVIPLLIGLWKRLCSPFAGRYFAYLFLCFWILHGFSGFGYLGLPGTPVPVNRHSFLGCAF